MYIVKRNKPGLKSYILYDSNPTISHLDKAKP